MWNVSSYLDATTLFCVIRMWPTRRYPKPFRPCFYRKSKCRKFQNDHIIVINASLHRSTPSPVLRLTLVLEGTGLGELEGDTTARKAAVDLGVGVEAVVNATTLLLVKDNLENLAAVLLGAETLADNLDRVDEISQDGIVDSSQSSRTGTLLCLGVAGAGRTLGAGQDAARSEDQHVAVRELLLKLTGETDGRN